MNKEDIIKLAAEAGAKAALAEWDKQWHEQRRQTHNTRLWNTKLLLKHYKALKDYCKNAVYDKQSALDSESPKDILEALGSCSKDTYIESVKSSVVRTQIIMAHIDVMIRIYKVFCETSGQPEWERRYRILDATYLRDETLRMEAICTDEKIDRSTYFRDSRATFEMLSALIFGADGLLAMRQR